MACIFFFLSCKEQVHQRQVSHAFYFWKSRLSLSATEKETLANLNITKLYVKFFDVDWNEELQSVQPAAKLRFDSAATHHLLHHNIQLIPVVFITNESLLQLDSATSIALAQKIMKLAGFMIQTQGLPPASEFQLDCDWTVTTRKNYFTLISEVKRQMKADHLSFSDSALLSATIRLHQVKYSSKSGIPEVDKGLLMCYNMGNLKNPSTKNSILDTDELKKYLNGLTHYPLQVDVALPLFNWAVLFRNKTYRGIAGGLSKEELLALPGSREKNFFTFSKDTTLQNISFLKNDQLRWEESGADQLLQTAGYISDRLASVNKNITVSFYHLDESLLNIHPQHELELLFHRFD